MRTYAWRCHCEPPRPAHLRMGLLWRPPHSIGRAAAALGLDEDDDDRSFAIRASDLL
ncbi:MAG: hypothetical protein ACLPTZ_00135 [Beijerinckiaceae bacterium]